MSAEKEVGRKVAGLFLGDTHKRARVKPHRCMACGKITKHVFCSDCGKRPKEERDAMRAARATDKASTG